jgi:hypothetical protein
MRHRVLGVCLVAGVGLACFVGSATTSQAQESPKEVRRVTITNTKPAKVVFGRSKDDVAGSIREASAAVSAAEDSDAKAAAEKKLADVLDKVFEDDLKRRESELVKIEERLKKLRALVALRREKKQEIIDLQRNVVLHEAEGLGFYDQPSASGAKALFGWDAARYGEGPIGGGGFSGGYSADLPVIDGSTGLPFGGDATSTPAAAE